jgi:hypothetical protein
MGETWPSWGPLQTMADDMAGAYGLRRPENSPSAAAAGAVTFTHLGTSPRVVP